MRKIAIMMRIRLDGEALNNEGNVGNVMQPRQIELCDGTIRNALSGEMLKHQHSRNVRLLANEDELCDTCKIFSPMKNGAIKEYDDRFSESGNRVKECLVDDIEGFMNAGGSKNEKRASTVKFSWGIATAENDYQTMLHNRVDPNTSGGKKKEGNGDTTSEGNTIEKQNAQMLFHRPIRSDEYAITIQVDLDRVGFDDEKLVYVLDEEEVKTRQRKCMQALINMFVDMEGAMCSTRLPHLREIEGILVDKQDKDEVLVKYSALNDDYIDVNERLASRSYRFNNIDEFVDVINSVVDVQQRKNL